MINKPDRTTADFLALLGDTDELTFVVLAGYAGGKVAIESRFGLIAFGNNVDELVMNVVGNVQQYFLDGFKGCIQLLEADEDKIVIHM